MNPTTNTEAGAVADVAAKLTEAQELLALADRVDATEKSDNGLDVLIEVALFEPDADAKSVRANAAGTKVIYTVADGRNETCWAPDWTVGFSERFDAAERLRALAQRLKQGATAGVVGGKERG